jgi:hypothetical protein
MMNNQKRAGDSSRLETCRTPGHGIGKVLSKKMYITIRTSVTGNLRDDDKKKPKKQEIVVGARDATNPRYM